MDGDSTLDTKRNATELEHKEKQKAGSGNLWFPCFFLLFETKHKHKTHHEVRSVM